LEILKHRALSDAQRINECLYGHSGALCLGFRCQAHYLVASPRDRRGGIVVLPESPDDWHEFISMKRPACWRAPLR
jgi:hypothetical protein